jgi:hypothetical protein
MSLFDFASAVTPRASRGVVKISRQDSRKLPETLWNSRSALEFQNAIQHPNGHDPAMGS